MSVSDDLNNFAREYLLINLTRKAADHLNISFTDLEPREGDFWRIDVIRIHRLKYLLCSHEVTLATSLLWGTHHRSVEAIDEALQERHPWYIGSPEAGLGKGSNRRITGSMTDMKKMMEYMPDRSVEELEEFMNHTPYSCLPTKWTEYEINMYRKNGGLSTAYLGALGKGKSEVELARMRFQESGIRFD